MKEMKGKCSILKMNNWDYLGDVYVILSHIVYDTCFQSKTY